MLKRLNFSIMKHQINIITIYYWNLSSNIQYSILQHPVKILFYTLINIFLFMKKIYIYNVKIY